MLLALLPSYQQSGSLAVELYGSILASSTLSGSQAKIIGATGQIITTSSLVSVIGLKIGSSGQISSAASSFSGYLDAIAGTQPQLIYGQINASSELSAFTGNLVPLIGQIQGQSSSQANAAINNCLVGQIIPNSELNGELAISGIVFGQMQGHSSLSGDASIILQVYAGIIEEANFYGSISSGSKKIIEYSNNETLRAMRAVSPPEPGRTRSRKSRRTTRKLYKEWVDKQ